MTKVSPGTAKQLNEGFARMYKKMRDPHEHEKKALQDKHKKNVERKSNRYGL